jgi:hypothetical protein
MNRNDFDGSNSDLWFLSYWNLANIHQLVKERIHKSLKNLIRKGYDIATNNWPVLFAILYRQSAGRTSISN